MQTNFTTQPLIQIIYKWRKSLLFFIIAATAIGIITALFLPKKYLSSTIVVPANPKFADKNFLHNTNPFELNSTYGMEEDLDRLLTNLRLSSNFSKMVDSFKLIEHYNIKNTAKAKANAIEELVENSTIVRTDNGAIKLNIWDKDQNYAANIANAIVAFTEYNSTIQSQVANASYLTTIQDEITKLELQLKSTDTIANSTIKEAQRKVIITNYEKNLTALGAIKLSMQAKAPSIIVLEKAYPSLKADKPKIKFWAFASIIASAFFGIFAIVLYESINRKK